MSGGEVAAAMGREDLALWLHLAGGTEPVTVVASATAPAWLTTLPRLRGVVAALDERTAAALGRGTVILFDGAHAVTPGTAAALHKTGAEVLYRHGVHWRMLPADLRPPLWPLRRLLARAMPNVAARYGIVQLRPPFQHVTGACWWASIGSLRVPAQGSGRHVVLFEDDNPLPPGDCVHDEIFQFGGGRYSVWGPNLYFSTPDGSDPAQNGHAYELRVVPRAQDRLAGTTGEEAFAGRFAQRAARRSAAPPSGKRVVLLIGSLASGGAERQFCNLAKGLAARGYAVAIASLDGYDGAAGHYLPLLEGSPVQRLDLSRPAATFDPVALEQRAPGALDLLRCMPDLFAADAWRVATHVATFSPDVLHCALDRTNLLGAIAGVAVGVPRIVLSMRNVNPTHFPYLDVPWFHRWYKLAATVPGLVLSANSHAGAADYARWLDLPPERVHTVHNGLDAAAMPSPGADEVQALRAELGIADPDPVLAGVFRLSPEKRPCLWLEVVARLRDRFPRLRALQVGQGPELSAMETRLRELGLHDTVTLLGRRSDPLLVLRAADVILLVSTFEGIPNVALEAQWLGRPVVCTAAGGSIEAVLDGVTGFVVGEPDADALAAACGRLLDDPDLRERMGRAGHELVATRFSVAAMVDGSIALYGASAAR